MTTTLTFEFKALVYAFDVTGNGNFPLDMLRHGFCWPETEFEDVPKIIRTGKAPRTISLLGLKRPRVERWASFGWTVGFIKVRELEWQD